MELGVALGDIRHDYETSIHSRDHAVSRELRHHIQHEGGCNGGIDVECHRTIGWSVGASRRVPGAIGPTDKG